MRTTRIFHPRITTPHCAAPRRRLSYRAYLPTIGTGFCMHTYIGSAADPAATPTPLRHVACTVRRTDAAPGIAEYRGTLHRRNTQFCHGTRLFRVPISSYLGIERK